jgi:UDP-N-acetylmuramate--alanine ligase
MSPGPFSGRSFWFVGIGGAGMSALALVCRAWGAEVGGSDRARSPYVDALERVGIAVVIGHDAANVPATAEVVVSSAIAADNPELGAAAGPVHRRGELLAELVERRPSIVVAGAHGKTTTASMIAFVLQRLGLDPAFLIGGDVPQLGGNAGVGEGWLVAEGDESDRSLLLLRPRVAVVTNVDLDHHAAFASRAEVETLFASWLASLPDGAAIVRGSELPPASELELAVPGAHNRQNAACALGALAAVGVDRDAAERVLPEFRGAGRRFQPVGEAAGIRVVDDYGHHPAEVAATLAAARSVAGSGRVLAVFQPHLYSRTLHLARELSAALTLADEAIVCDVYPAREEPVAGVTGRLVVEGLSELRPGLPVGWAPRLEDAAALAVARARPGDLVLTIGAGDVDRVGGLILALLGGGGPGPSAGDV